MHHHLFSSDNGGEAASKEAEELYKNGDKKVKSSVKVHKRKDIDARPTKAHNVANKGDKPAVYINTQLCGKTNNR